MARLINNNKDTKYLWNISKSIKVQIQAHTFSTEFVRKAEKQ